MKIIKKIFKSLFWSIIILYSIRLILLPAMLLGPLYFFLTPLFSILIYPIISLFVLSIIIFVVFFIKDHKKEDSGTSIENKVTVYFGVSLSIIYIFWFSFISAYNSHGLNSLNCLSFPCPDTGVLEIMRDTAPTILGLNFTKEDKLMRESFKNNNLDSCKQISVVDKKYRCIEQVLKINTKPEMCFEAYTDALLKTNIAFPYLQMQFCYRDIAKKTHNPNICTMLRQEAVGPFYGTLADVKAECLNSLNESTYGEKNFSIEEILKVCDESSDVEFKNKCYINFAINSKDIKICDKIVETVFPGSNGNVNKKDDCVAIVSNMKY